MQIWQWDLFLEQSVINHLVLYFAAIPCSIYIILHGFCPNCIQLINFLVFVAIAQAGCERDQGDIRDIISKNLKPKNQYKNISKKSNRTLGLINRSLSNKKPGVVLQLYITTVRHPVDYAVQIVTTYYGMDINLLERVQRRMTKVFSQNRNLA